MAGVAPVSPKFQFLSSAGAPLVSGTVDVYLAGTTTRTNTWQDQAQVTLNTNPIVLDSRGEASIWLDSSLTYKFVVKNAAGVQQWAEDNISGGSALGSIVSFIQSGTGPVSRTIQGARRDFATIEDFLGDDYDYTATDASAAIVTAATWSATNKKVVVFSHRYRVANCAAVTASGVSFHFDGCQFDILDTGTSGTTVAAATGKIGLHFKEADDLRITGSATFVGQGTPGTTSLLGVMFDNCDDVSCPAFMRFETMAIGRNITNCTRGTWGDAQGYSMYGLQTFESPPTNNAGSVENVVGCSYCSFGDAIGYEQDKPVRYLSVGTGSTDNIMCSFGASICHGRTGSLTAHALALRSAVDCSFGPVSARNSYTGLLITQYNTDAAYSVDRNTIESVTGDYPSTGASADAAISQETTSTNPIGTNTIGSVNVTCAGELGLHVTSGTLNIGAAKLTGAATRLVRVSATTGVATLNVGTLEISGNTSSPSPVTIGNGGKFSAGHIDFSTGPTAAVTAAIRYDSAFGSGSLQGVNIGTIRYTQNGSANNYTYVAMDLTNGFESWQIGHIDGTGATAQARFGSDAFSIKKGRVSATTIPTSGTYTAGTLLGKSNASAGGITGWICTTGGTPGTWTEYGHSHLTGSVAYDPGNLVDGDGVTTTVTVTGAAVGDMVDVSFGVDLQGITLTGWVSAADTVSVRFQNETGGAINLSNQNIRARVRKV